MKYIDITILGCGNVGAELFFLLMHHEQPIRINIIEPDKNREGAILDIAHINASANQHRIFINNYELISEADFVFHAAGYCNKTGEARLTVAEKNVRLTYSIFKNIYFRKNPFIIVITNPVDLICYATYLSGDNSDRKIIGTGTFLDSLRLQYYTSIEFNCEMHEVKGLVLGEHGDSMVPVFSRAFVKDKPVFESAYLKQLDNIATNTITAASTIRKKQSGTWYGVAHCSYSIFNNILKEKVGPFSLSIKTNDFYREFLDIKNDLFIGLPAIFNDGKYEPSIDFEINAAEKEMLQNSARILHSYSEKIKTWINE